MMKQQNLIGYLDDTVDIIEELPANIVGKIIIFINYISSYIIT